MQESSLNMYLTGSAAVLLERKVSHQMNPARPDRQPANRTAFTLCPVLVPGSLKQCGFKTGHAPSTLSVSEHLMTGMTPSMVDSRGPELHQALSHSTAPCSVRAHGWFGQSNVGKRAGRKTNFGAKNGAKYKNFVFFLVYADY